MYGLNVYLFKGLEIVTGFAGLNEPPLVNINMAEAAWVAVYLGLVKPQFQVATAARRDLVGAFERVVCLCIVVECKIFTGWAPCCGGMAVLARYGNRAMRVYGLSSLSICCEGCCEGGCRYQPANQGPRQAQATYPVQHVHREVGVFPLTRIIVFNVTVAILAFHAERFVSNEGDTLGIGF